jgi:hypothetical protein
MLQVLDRNILPRSFNYAGHPVLGKSVMVVIPIKDSIQLAESKYFLSVDSNAYQLQRKKITCIIANARFVPPPSIYNGNLLELTGIANGNIATSNDFRLYGFCLTLVDRNNKTLVYSYPLINLMITSPQKGVPSTNVNGRTPRTYKFFDCEIDINNSYISTFDPTIITKTTLISLTFYYKD